MYGSIRLPKNTAAKVKPRGIVHCGFIYCASFSQLFVYGVAVFILMV